MSKLLLLILLLGVLVMLYLFYDKIMLVIDDNSNNSTNSTNNIQKLKFSSDKPQKPKSNADKPQKQTKYDFIDEESESVEFDETTVKSDNTHNSAASSDLFDSATDNKSTYTINTLELQKN